MQLTLTVESIGFKNLSSTVSTSFETTRMSDIQDNPNSGINGNTYFVYEDMNGIAEVYTVTETVAFITGTSTSGTTESFFAIHDGEADEIHIVNTAGAVELMNADEDEYVDLTADTITADTRFVGDLTGNVDGDVTGSVTGDVLLGIGTPAGMFCAKVTTISAYATGGQANATVIQYSTFFQNVGTVASAGDSVKLSNEFGSKENAIQFVRNSGANAMNLFPNVGGNINGAGANAAISIAANTTYIIYSNGGNNFIAIIFG